jgi:acyl-CoA hydrolase
MGRPPIARQVSQARAQELIGIALPTFRNELTGQANRMNIPATFAMFDALTSTSSKDDPSALRDQSSHDAP